MSVSDIGVDNPDVPLLAEFIYKHYPYDVLHFEIDTIRKTMEFLHQLYPDNTKDELERMQQILRLQAIIKFCQYGENLAAFAIVFLSTYDDENQEMLGMFNKISRYGIGEIIDFYKNMIKRENDYVAKFYGYPPLNLQFPKPRSFFELSCKNIKETLVEVGQLCIEFHEFYNAYKHGYRIIIGKDKNNAAMDIFPFIDSTGNQKFAQIDNDTIKKVFKLSTYIRQILESILEQHQIRVEYEKQGGDTAAVRVKLFLRGSDPTPNQEDLRIIYPNRGDRLKQDKMKGDRLYDVFKQELEKKDKGKIVAIDVDEQKIISKDYMLGNVIADIRDSGISSRIHLRRVGEHGRIGIEIY